MLKSTFAEQISRFRVSWVLAGPDSPRYNSPVTGDFRSFAVYELSSRALQLRYAAPI